MKKIIARTLKEINEYEEKAIRASEYRIKVKDTNEFCWTCKKCSCVFFADDEIIGTKHNSYFEAYCPNIHKGLFTKKECHTELSCCSSEYRFNKYYKIK